MPPPDTHPVLAQLRAAPGPRPLVAGHRGASCVAPENTLEAFRLAKDAGAVVQEFDVRELRCGALVCVHDATFDRTTDAASRLGPGGLVAQLTWETVRGLDAGGWFDARFAGARVPRLAEALAVMLPEAVPLIEHKAGAAERYVAALREGGHVEQVVLQSFDWRFLREVRELEPRIALGALGPGPACGALDEQAIAAVVELGASVLHWRAGDWTRDAVRTARRRGLLTCSYTTDDELGWLGGRALGLDVMCSNDPAGMRAALAR